MSNTETLVFVGDSLTQAGDWASWFPDDDVVNLGVGGDTVADLTERIGDVIAARPDSVVLMIGTNDVGARRSVEQVVRGIENLMVVMRRELPGTRLLLQSIAPRQAEFAARIKDANRHLRQFSSTVRAQYLDLWPALAGDDDALRPEFSDDGVHLTAAGYEAWLAELRPGLERLRDEPPMSRPLTVIDSSYEID
ncbi:GDSL-type esterase/lipase family protein [Frigoribacterium sp. 2-23]|uniref:GDSL-type esterase/lipase family protein n=1 Tax=Frigoribacterium sp. 2-23 TaxID=3415006 RepID=UPI003C6FE51F